VLLCVDCHQVSLLLPADLALWTCRCSAVEWQTCAIVCGLPPGGVTDAAAHGCCACVL
jgi:hypothetical protein